MKWLAILALVGASPAWASGAAVRGSKHDLSATGPGPIRAMTETNVCLPCHVSHSGITNRPDLRVPHVPYASSTMTARPGAPTGASRICLSCHDGTIAVGETKSGRIRMTTDFIPATSASNLGTDLRKSHPVSFRPADVGRTHPPAPGDAVRLDRFGELQCTSCHDPHKEFGDPVLGKFLVKPSQRSALCLSCHDAVEVEGPGSSHASAGASFGAAAGNRNGFASVADAGCFACHDSHRGDVKGRLVPPGDDDGPCLRCHSGSVARVNIGAELAKASAHASAERGVHDASEGRPGSRFALPETSPGARRHVVCVDCHDPHAASDRPAAMGGVGGALAGVWGIDRNGQRVEQVRFEYELCFKCHADSANRPHSAGSAPGAPRRAFPDANLRDVFAATAVSFHPVVAPGRNTRMPGLVAPYTPAATIACGDCHASESGPGAGGSGPRGPHGSFYPRLLERNYSTADNTPESAAAYALCYKCHDRDTLVAPDRRDLARYPDPSAFADHALHLGPTVNAPCSACHAAHGVSAKAGSPLENAHLVDFDVNIVQTLRGERRYRSDGPGQGSCTLKCHDEEHAARTYQPPVVVAAP